MKRFTLLLFWFMFTFARWAYMNENGDAFGRYVSLFTCIFSGMIFLINAITTIIKPDKNGKNNK